MTPDDVVVEVVRRTLEAAPTPGGGRLLCIDGPAGSGKTTLAAAVAAHVPAGLSTGVVHLDDVYPGWDGLEEGVARAGRLLVGPYARGEAGRYRRYDWFDRREAEWVEVEPVDLLVLEGVGAGAATHADHITTLVWLEAPRGERLERGLARDAAALGTPEPDAELRARWAQWSHDEDTHHERNRTRERADLVVAGVA